MINKTTIKFDVPFDIKIRVGANDLEPVTIRFNALNRFGLYKFFEQTVRFVLKFSHVLEWM